MPVVVPPVLYLTLAAVEMGSLDGPRVGVSSWYMAIAPRLSSNEETNMSMVSYVPLWVFLLHLLLSFLQKVRF